MEPEQLIARVQELTGRLEDLDDPACRELAEELTAAVVQMYGAGLERIVELADDEHPRRDGQGRSRRGAADDPRPLSGPDRGACDPGARHGPALHGVARRQRRAARDRERDRQAAPRGQLQVVPGVVVDARAGGAAGARGGGARPRRDGRRGDRGGGRGAGDQRDPAADRAGERAPPVRGTRWASTAPRRSWPPTSTACRSWWPTSTGRCSPTATGAPTAAGRCDGGALDGGALGCPGCGRSYFLPQAGRSMDDDHLQLQPVPLLREQEEIKVAL